MNDALLLTFALLTGLFVLLLIVKAIFKLNFCVLCGAVSLTWISLVGLFWAGLFEDILLIALLMGGSVVGIYYLVEKWAREQWYIFRFPFFLTLVFLAYLLLKFEFNASVFIAAGLVVFLWLICGFLYFFRNNSKFKSVVSKLIDCCKNW